MPDQVLPAGTILEQYVRTAPTPQNAIDIFAGEWASQFPAGFETLRAGSARLFEDARLQWGLPLLGGVAGRRVLELGPLEGGHSYMLEQAGAAEVIAIEANTRAYLKCLITGEILSLARVRFLCGDFLEFLRRSPPRFDACLALGVLYHMLDPVELIELISRCCDRVLIWTHYYDAGIMSAADPRFAQRFRAAATRGERAGFAHTLYPDAYGVDLAKPGFCGGSNPTRNWLSRDDVLACLTHFGLARIEVQDDPNHPHAPAMTLVARRG